MVCFGGDSDQVDRGDWNSYRAIANVFVTYVFFTSQVFSNALCFMVVLIIILPLQTLSIYRRVSARWRNMVLPEIF